MKTHPGGTTSHPKEDYLDFSDSTLLDRRPGDQNMSTGSAPALPTFNSPLRSPAPSGVGVSPRSPLTGEVGQTIAVPDSRFPTTPTTLFGTPSRYVVTVLNSCGMTYALTRDG